MIQDHKVKAMIHNKIRKKTIYLPTVYFGLISLDLV
jgi:hypothetical protein